MNNLSRFIADNALDCTSNVHVLSASRSAEAQEKAYLAVRDKEGRVYPDELLARLPEVERDHPLYREWRIRGRGMKRLVRYLAAKRRPLHLLDVGCGNGWMSRHLAEIPDCTVYALDMNRHELEQGARVFSGHGRLHFLFGDLFEEILPPASFDAIVLAGSIQYFSDLPRLLTRLFDLVADQGEIHIVDSPFYTRATAPGARERTKQHFSALGHPEMADYYHPPLHEELALFRPELLYNPGTVIQRLCRRFLQRDLSPFPWIRLAKSDVPADNK